MINNVQERENEIKFRCQQIFHRKVYFSEEAISKGECIKSVPVETIGIVANFCTYTADNKLVKPKIYSHLFFTR